MVVINAMSLYIPFTTSLAAAGAAAAAPGATAFADVRSPKASKTSETPMNTSIVSTSSPLPPPAQFLVTSTVCALAILITQMHTRGPFGSFGFCLAIYPAIILVHELILIKKWVFFSKPRAGYLSSEYSFRQRPPRQT